MIKLVPSQPKWLASLIILVVVTLLIGGCMPANQPPVTFGVAANHPPVIDSLTAERERVRRAMTSTIVCVASDPDDDELSYIWSVNGGSISGEGSIATWVAPNAYGTYTVTVTVTDGKGGQAIKTIDIVVTCCLCRQSSKKII